MSNDKTTKKHHVRFWKVLLFIITIITVCLVVVPLFLLRFYYKYDFKIDSQEKLIAAINHSADARREYDYVLTQSFDVDISALPAGKSFYGHLNGNGNTITIKSEGESPMNAPLFDKIQEGASIESLSVKLDAVLGDDKNATDIALFANENFGKIKDCFISVGNIFIGAKCRNAAVLTNNNFGEINSVCVNINGVESTQLMNNWQCDFGAIATTNYAVVKNAFINVSFKNIDIFNAAFNNQNVGYVFGRIGNNVKATDMDRIFLFGDSTFWSYSTDFARMTAAIKGDKPTDQEVSEFINYNKKDDNDEIWLATLRDGDTGFPLLNSLQDN